MENRAPNGTPRKPKKQDMAPYWDHKSGTNVTIENLYNCKSTFIWVFAEKVTEFRE